MYKYIFDFFNMRIALFQPDIPQNTGNIIRLCSCFNIPIDIIEPAGFFFSDKKLSRSSMDYFNNVKLKRHLDWENFYVWSKKNQFNLILLTTKAKQKYFKYKFNKKDILLFGRESSGVPNNIHKTATKRLVIPMKKGMRSLNISSAVAIVVGEALIQLKQI